MSGTQRRRSGGPLSRANTAAAAAANDWLVARGLIAEIDVIRRSLPSALPVPGIEELMGAIGSAADEAGAAADAVFVALQDPDVVAEGSLLRQEVRSANDAAARSGLGVRRLAQLMLGVSSHAGGQAATYRAERAAVFVLVGTRGQVRALPADGPWWASRTLEEFAVELAGAMCRLILEQSWRLRIIHEQGWIDLSMREGGTLELESGLPGLLARQWKDPLPVLEVVDEVFDALASLTRRDSELFDQIRVEVDDAN